MICHGEDTKYNARQPDDEYDPHLFPVRTPDPVVLFWLFQCFSDFKTPKLFSHN